MSISTASMGSGGNLQHSQKIGQLAVGGTSAQGAVLNQSAGVKPIAKPVADVKGETDKPSAEHLQQSLEDINKVLAGFSISVQFQIDPDYKELIVKVVDQDTGKLIRQIPTEDVVKMSKAMDNLKGLLFAQSV